MIDKIASLIIRVDNQQLSADEAVKEASRIIRLHDEAISLEIKNISKQLDSIVDKI